MELGEGVLRGLESTPQRGSAELWGVSYLLRGSNPLTSPPSNTALFSHPSRFIHVQVRPPLIRPFGLSGAFRSLAVVSLVWSLSVMDGSLYWSTSPQLVSQCTYTYVRGGQSTPPERVASFDTFRGWLCARY